MNHDYRTKLSDLSSGQLKTLLNGVYRLLSETEYYSPEPLQELARQTDKAIRQKRGEQTRAKVKSPPKRQTAHNGIPSQPFLPNVFKEDDLHRPPENSTAGAQPCKGAKARLSPDGEPQAVTRLTRRAQNKSPIVAPRRRKKSG